MSEAGAREKKTTICKKRKMMDLFGVPQYQYDLKMERSGEQPLSMNDIAKVQRNFMSMNLAAKKNYVQSKKATKKAQVSIQKLITLYGGDDGDGDGDGDDGDGDGDGGGDDDGDGGDGDGDDGDGDGGGGDGDGDDGDGDGVGDDDTTTEKTLKPTSLKVEKEATTKTAEYNAEYNLFYVALFLCLLLAVAVVLYLCQGPARKTRRELAAMHQELAQLPACSCACEDKRRSI